MAAAVYDQRIGSPIREMLKGFVGRMSTRELYLPSAVRGRKAQNPAYRLA